METHVAPEARTAVDRYLSMIEPRDSAARVPLTQAVVPFPTPVRDSGFVNQLPEGVIAIHQRAYALGNAQAATLQAERDQFLQERNDAVNELAAVNARLLVLERMMQDLRLVQHGSPLETRPPPPRADPSHGAAGAAGAPGPLDSF